MTVLLLSDVLLGEEFEQDAAPEEEEEVGDNAAEVMQRDVISNEKNDLDNPSVMP